ncbi:unnamed protein product [Lymnaea stagnalis]|uniref:Thyroid transcription factor 1-associated protein 26 n=1 Tax=Lymnaea stagnalis TaxID=6523 RepID=A0AAV2HFR2_LYMST
MNKKEDVFKPFTGNKNEGQGFADKRKRKAAYEYMKLLKKEKRQHVGGDAPKHKPIALLHPIKRTPDQGKKRHAFSTAEKIARKKQEEKETKKKEAERLAREKAAALTSYKDRKKQRHLKLCKRTSKGQPVMKYQMEVLLEKIQSRRNEKKVT